MAAPITPEKGKVISQFLEHCDIQTYSTKQLIIREGDPSNDLYYIISGSVTVVIEDTKGNEFVLAYLNPGEFFGEIALIQNIRRTATIFSITNCRLLVLEAVDFHRLVDQIPELKDHIERTSEERLSANHRQSEE